MRFIESNGEKYIHAGDLVNGICDAANRVILVTERMADSPQKDESLHQAAGALMVAKMIMEASA